MLKSIPESASGEEWAKAAAKAIANADDLEKIDALAWRRLIGLYITSAVIGVSAAVAFAMALPGLGLALVVLNFVIIFAIEYFKDNKVQEWLERCLWGRGHERYATAEEELAQLKLALAN